MAFEIERGEDALVAERAEHDALDAGHVQRLQAELSISASSAWAISGVASGLRTMIILVFLWTKEGPPLWGGPLRGLPVSLDCPAIAKGARPRKRYASATKGHASG
jgi:hypothetical protein